MSSNPLITDFNTVIDFNSLQSNHIDSLIQQSINHAKSQLNTILNVAETERTFENTMKALDDLFHEISLVLYPVYLMGSVHTEADVREASDKFVAELSKFQNELNLNEDLYKAVQSYAESAEAKNLTGAHQKFTEETVKEFERNGFALAKEKRDELKIIQDTLADLSIEFQKNISEYKDELSVTEEDIDGLPDDYKSARQQEDGTYKIDLTYPSYVPFMKYSTSDNARKALYMKYQNRAANKNLTVLRSLLKERKKLSNLLGYTTYAEYRVENRMVKHTDVVWNFEEKLSSEVKVKAEHDYAELLKAKRAYLKNEEISVVNPWEKGFYNNQLLKTEYALDNEKVKEYFELNHVINGLFKIAQQLFDVEFKEVSDVSKWHNDVRLFEVIKNGNVSGRFYVDLHPRDNKYGHAACFGITEGKRTTKGYQTPVAALVCNFTQGTPEKPSLLLHDDVVTMFHEFGHVLHSILTKSELGVFSGTSVARDFVETPSQLFENWAWNYESLQLFALHYKTGELLPKDLHDKMISAKNVGSGLDTQQQILYGIIDMTLHDNFDPESETSTTEIVKELQNKHTYFPYLEGTAFEASFGHLDGYAAGYYGYLWSKVYAEDFFSKFEEHGVLNPEQGKRYRDIILARGGSQDEFELVKEFLEREPNDKAFLKSLGV